MQGPSACPAPSACAPLRPLMKEPNFYAAGGLDRVGHRRKDAAWIAERLAHPSSRFVPVWRSQNLIVTSDGAVPRAAFLARHEIGAEGETALLGIVGECAYFAVDLSHIEAPLEALRPAGALEFTDLRRVGPLLARHEGSLLAYARGIAHWHMRHRFCALSATPTVSAEGGR